MAFRPVTIVAGVFALVALLKCNGQLCTVSSPTITTTSSTTGGNTDVCQAVSQGSLSYTCTVPDGCLIWKSPLFECEPFNIVARNNQPADNSVNGRLFTVTHNSNEACLVATLMINASMKSLVELNGKNITCHSCGQTSFSKVTIIVPDFPEPPKIGAARMECDEWNKTRMIVEWTPPTKNGGESVVITHYKVNLTGSNGYNYRNNITTPYIVISGLECNTSYTLSVTAVNCVGESEPSKFPIPKPGQIEAPNITNVYFDDACSEITVEWVPPASVNNSHIGCSCTKIQSYTYKISNGTTPILVEGRNRMSVNLSDYPDDLREMSLQLFANTRCGTSQVAKVQINNTCIESPPGTPDWIIGISIVCVILSVIFMITITAIGITYYLYCARKLCFN